MGGGYFILLKRTDLGGFGDLGYRCYLLLNELDRLEGNPFCYTISKVSPKSCLCRPEFPLFLL
jgi:hypothetical protein